jgi:hypothetical protein
MYEKYRVICGFDKQSNPIVDIAVADTLTHDDMRRCRTAISPEVDNVLTGIILTDLGNGEVNLQYEKAYNYRLKQYQDMMIPKFDRPIRDTFKQMREAGKARTFEVNAISHDVMYDFYKAVPGTPVSAREADLIQKQHKQEQIQKIKEARNAWYASRPHADTPHLVLAMKQAMHDGD